MFFSVILILLIAIVFRKQKMAETGQQKSDEIEHLSKNKKELILGLSWYIFYFMLSYISCAYQVDIISELSNWLFLVFFPLLIIAVFRKEKVIQTLKETGLKHFDRKTVVVKLFCNICQRKIKSLIVRMNAVSATLDSYPKGWRPVPLSLSYGYPALLMLCDTWTDSQNSMKAFDVYWLPWAL